MPVIILAWNRRFQFTLLFHLCQWNWSPDAPDLTSSIKYSSVVYFSWHLPTDMQMKLGSQSTSARTNNRNVWSRSSLEILLCCKMMTALSSTLGRCLSRLQQLCSAACCCVKLFKAHSSLDLCWTYIFNNKKRKIYCQNW